MKVATITFLCDQQGSPEDELKHLLSRYFKSVLGISSAFLLRVKYGNSDEQKVALCIRGDGLEEKAVVAHVSQTFRQTFNSQQSLDIIFLDPDQAKQALGIGTPFYVQAATRV
jgi:hypothetical protein